MAEAFVTAGGMESLILKVDDDKILKPISGPGGIGPRALILCT